MPKIDAVILDILEHHVEPIAVSDAREQLGGTCVNAVLRVRSSNGVEGQALVGSFGDDPTWSITQIRDEIGQLLPGRYTSSRGRLWHELDGLTSHGHPIESAWAWLDLALWDLAGKSAGFPVSELLGTVRESIPVIATHPPLYSHPGGFINEAAHLVEQGITAVKTHPGDLETVKVVETVQAIRRELGDDITLVLDANNGYGVEQAITVAEGLDGAHYSWFEDPFPAGRVLGLEMLLDKSRTPVALGDESSVRFRERVHLMEGHGLPIIRASSRDLGITGAMRLSIVAEALDRRCELGVGGNATVNAANLHLAAAAQSGHYEHWLPAHAHQFAAHTYLDPSPDGSISPPSALGLGVALDEDWISAHRVSRHQMDTKGSR